MYSSDIQFYRLYRWITLLETLQRRKLLCTKPCRGLLGRLERDLPTIHSFVGMPRSLQAIHDTYRTGLPALRLLNVSLRASLTCPLGKVASVCVPRGAEAFRLALLWRYSFIDTVVVRCNTGVLS